MIGEFFLAIGKAVDIVLEIYKWMIIIAALISWVNPDPYNPIVRFLYSVTEPVLRPIRRIIGFRLGPIDISPVVAILAIIFLQSFLVRTLINLGYRLGGG